MDNKNNRYIPNMDDDDKVPEIRQNEIPEKVAIGLVIFLAVWVVVFLILRGIGIISALIMRICVYPVILGILIAYMVIKNKNNRL